MKKKILILMGMVVFAVAVSLNVNTIASDGKWVDVVLSDVEALSQAECSYSNPYGGHCYTADTSCCGGTCGWCGCMFNGMSSSWCYYG
jgi:hypothetical protein